MCNDEVIDIESEDKYLTILVVADHDASVRVLEPPDRESGDGLAALVEPCKDLALQTAA